MEHLHHLRHKNGSGKILDASEACERSFIDRQSSVSENSSIWQSHIKNSKIIRSTIVGAKIIDSEVLYTLVAGEPEITDSYIEAEAVLNRAKIINSNIFGKSRVAHNARVNNCSFSNLTVKGEAVLTDWRNLKPFEGHNGYINKGVWTRPPRVFPIAENVSVTESVPGFLFVQCTEYPIDKLLKIGNRLGRSQNWTKSQILTVRKICHFLRT